MASVQCYKADEETSSQKGQEKHSLGQKVSEMASSIFKGHGSQRHRDGRQTSECYSQTEAHYGVEKSQSQTSYYYSEMEVQYTDHGLEKTQTNYCYSQTQGQGHPAHTSQTNGNQAGHHASGATTCQGKTKTTKRGEKKRGGLLQKIKDGLSGDSSSSSDSESDDEKCGTRKS